MKVTKIKWIWTASKKEIKQKGEKNQAHMNSYDKCVTKKELA